MTIAHNLGFPAIGALRELKRATENYWSGKASQADLLKTGAELRARHWRLQQDAGLDLVPCNDFSFYDRVLDACALVGAANPVLIGPVTFLLLGKSRAPGFDRLSLLDALLPVYAQVLESLAAQGARWIQLDEPMLALDRTRAELEAYRRAYGWLADRAGGARLLLATYFAGLDDNLENALALPIGRGSCRGKG